MIMVASLVSTQEFMCNFVAKWAGKMPPGRVDVGSDEDKRSFLSVEL